LKAIITQNVDGLHQRAGSKRVIEFHGSGETLTCLDCRKKYKIYDVDINVPLPKCSCGGVLKPDIVFFGEMIPPEALDESMNLARCADVFMVVGTSAQVYPAAGLPIMAKERGARIIEINLELTQLTSSITDVFLQGRAGEILPLLVGEILKGNRSKVDNS
ncbi:MAG: SIR2 family NAD-dependent protein deacylase, partial [Thermosulfidibacteraceae bacterium]